MRDALSEAGLVSPEAVENLPGCCGAWVGGTDMRTLRERRIYSRTKVLQRAPTGVALVGRGRHPTVGSHRPSPCLSVSALASTPHANASRVAAGLILAEETESTPP